VPKFHLYPFPIVRFLFALLLVVAFARPTHADEVIRIMAANITSGNLQSYDPGHGNRMFQGLKPDIALVQEMNFGNNTASALRAWVNANFGTGFSYFCEAGAQIPNGIVSRYPILASGEWNDSNVSNRDFAWAKIDIPGDKDLWAISVHFLTTSSANRKKQADLLLTYIAANIPAGDYLVLGGDFNTDLRTETCITALSAEFVTSSPWPVDQSSNSNTNAGRSKPYDWVLADNDLNACKTPLIIGNRTFTDGLVFDSRVYTPISEVAPVLSTDSAASNMQHMAVLRAFSIPTATPPLNATISLGNLTQTYDGSPKSATASTTPSGLKVSISYNGSLTAPTNIGNYSLVANVTETNYQGTATAIFSILAPTPTPTPSIFYEDFASLTAGGDSSTTAADETALTSINSNFPTSVHAYSAGGKALLGTSTQNGSITSKALNLTGNNGNFTVKFKVKGWTTITAPLRVTAAGQSQNVTITSNLTAGYESKTLTFSGGTANATLKLETLGSRIFLDDILVETPGVSFSAWSGGLAVTPEMLKIFAIGGALTPDSSGESPSLTLEGGTLSLTATIRTSDPKLSVKAESTSVLTESWTSNGVTSTIEGISQTNVPSGNERRKFSVPTSQDSTRFLRLKATLAP
jgi:endonuclease/exonuclease/phosphatase family metal-dependent hydrolase